MRAVSTRSFADCSARSLDLADCRSRDEERSARVLGVVGGTILDSWLVLGTP